MGKRLKRWMGWLVMVALAVPWLGVSHAQGEDPGMIGVFEQTPCWAEVAGAGDRDDLLCGYVTVPEHHGSRYSATIRLAVVVVKSTASDPAPDPLVIEAGGPGYTSLSSAPGLLVMADFRAQRDLVLVEQRGVDYSDPHIVCGRGLQLVLETYGQNLSAEEVTTLETEVLRPCRIQWTARGVDLSAYNSLENAADFPLVMQALGYDSYNFYGISYSSALAQHLMRDFPEGLRTVILDAVVPLSDGFVSEAARSTGAAFDRFFASCAADPVCGQAFPDLETVFYDLVADFNAQPRRVTMPHPAWGRTVEAEITGDHLVAGLYQQLYWTNSIPLLPLAIYALRDGDDSFIHDYVTPTWFTGLRVTNGMHLSVMCSEFTSEDDEFVTEGVHPAVVSAMGRLLTFEHVCRVWNVDPLPAEAHQPVTSDIPTLILSGEFDPITPPKNGEQVAATLSHSYTYAFPGIGHGALGHSVCAQDIVLDFLADPSQAPDASCIDEMGIHYVQEAGFAGRDIVLTPVTVDRYGLRIAVPEGWTALEPGTWGSPGLEAIFTAYAEADWDTVRAPYDLVLAPKEQVEIAGRVWRLHDARVFGMDGVIATWSVPGAVYPEGPYYVVGVFGALDQLDTLTESVLLPALEAFELVGP